MNITELSTYAFMVDIIYTAQMTVSLCVVVEKFGRIQDFRSSSLSLLLGIIKAINCLEDN